MRPLIIWLTLCVVYCVKCEQDCDHLGTILYEDLGCAPIRKGGNECPIKYRCDDFSRRNDSCQFRGSRYNINEKIDNDLTYASCNVECVCSRDNYVDNIDLAGNPKIATEEFLKHEQSTSQNIGGTKFTCTNVNCPEWQGIPIAPGCYRKYEADKCCSVGVNCPDEASEVPECIVDGRTFKEGDKFFPKDSCQKCVCSRNYEGLNDVPFCKRLTCGVQINRAQELASKCAPAYLGSPEKPLCCPDAWVCPKPTDVIITVNPNGKENSELRCEFGNKVIKLGEGLETTVNHHGKDHAIKCECILPPLLTCK